MKNLAIARFCLTYIGQSQSLDRSCREDSSDYSGVCTFVDNGHERSAGRRSYITTLIILHASLCSIDPPDCGVLLLARSLYDPNDHRKPKHNKVIDRCDRSAEKVDGPVIGDKIGFDLSSFDDSEVPLVL